ncbi:MAG TPA: crosslink repair DNA glycosylase YcaQ family protein [Candidatus Limnocylindrales bacterium]
MTERGSIDQRHLLVRRSASQLLNRRIAGGPEVAVRALLAVQAQDRSAWRLALRARVDDITADDVNRALSDKRSLVVAWLNRGTLHLVCSEDYPWLLALAAPTQVVANGHRLAQEGLTPDAVDRGVACIERSLATDGPLLRGQLRERLAALGIRTEGQATVHLLFAAVLRGVAVLGPVLAGARLPRNTTPGDMPWKPTSGPRVCGRVCPDEMATGPRGGPRARSSAWRVRFSSWRRDRRCGP